MDTVIVTNRQPYCNHSNVRVIVVTSHSFLDRLSQAYALVNWASYKQLIVIRPDVILTKSITINQICNIQKTTYVISGSNIRYYIFHNRDWDLGYVVCNPSLFYYVTINNRTPTTLPTLPSDFHGCWGQTTCRRYEYMENVIWRHLEAGVVLRNLDNYNIFLTIRRDKKCSSSSSNSIKNKVQW